MSILLAAALATTTPLIATAATRQPEIIVTATRRADSVDDTLASIDVLTRRDIEASQAADLLTLLQGIAGIDVARTGGSGQSSSVFVRGSNSNHVLVLIDGVRVASANTGAYAWEHLPLSQVERIEIVRGPRAAYWGSDAIGGVIAITTRVPDAAGASATLGRYGRRSAHARAAFGDTDAGFGVVLGGERVDGFSAQTEDGFSFDPDDDGYRNRNLALRGAAALGSQRVDASGLAVRAAVEFDRGESDVRQHHVGASVRGALGQQWSHALTLGQARETIDTAAFFSRFETRRANLDWVHDIRYGAASYLVLGINLAREAGASIDTFGGEPLYQRTRRTRAVFAATQGRHGAFDYELALRHDDDDVFGGETTTQGAAGWRFGAGRLFVARGEGFRAPNFNQLYSPGFGGQFAGNPALGPERSDSLELGVDAELGAWRLGARAYRSRIDDLIAFQGPAFSAINVRRADIDGVELAAGTAFGAWRVDLDLGWLDAVDRDSGRALLRRADYRHGLVVGYTGDGGFGAQAELLRVGPRRDFGTELEPYTLLGAGVEWPLGHGLKLGARVDNLLDEDYVLAAGFATPGREWRLTLDWEAAR